MSRKDFMEGFIQGLAAAGIRLDGIKDVPAQTDMAGDVMDALGFNFDASVANVQRRTKKTRKASAWNVFVRNEMPKVLKKHPRFTPQRAMKEVSRRWKSSPKNPNRRKRR